MADFSKLIENKAAAARYMVDEITHICKDMPKRTPGEEGERVACEYMADVLKNDCGCERSDVESFKENPGSFFGWIYNDYLCACGSRVVLLPADSGLCSYRIRIFRNDYAVRTLQKNI